MLPLDVFPATAVRRLGLPPCRLSARQQRPHITQSANTTQAPQPETVIRDHVTRVIPGERIAPSEISIAAAPADALETVHRADSATWLDVSRTAVHEAGHSVAAFLENVGIEEVRLHLFEEAGKLRCAGGLMVKRDRRGSALLSLAGIAAARVLGWPEDRTSTRQDREKAAVELERRGFVPELHMESTIREAQGKLEKHWVAVRALADELMNHVRLDGATAERTIQAALSGSYYDVAAQRDLRQRHVVGR